MSQNNIPLAEASHNEGEENLTMSPRSIDPTLSSTAEQNVATGSSGKYLIFVFLSSFI